jgi:DNA topoisomerase-1
MELQLTCDDFNKYLIIVESPSKIHSIESYLGEEYKVIASNGHLRDMKSFKDLENPIYKNIDSKKDTICFMQSIIKKYDENDIIIGTDRDNEGEKIAYDICIIFGLNPETTKRIIFNEITKNALCNAIKIPSLINMNIVKCQQARQIVDILIGHKLSPLLWKYIYHEKAKNFSAGRCQTSALALIYDNEKKAETTITEKKYKTVGHFFEYPSTLEFNLSFDFTEIDDIRHFLELSKTHNHEIKIGVKKLRIIPSPLPFNTVSLIEKSTYSPKQTMDLAQKLYQEGYITYMRTESKSKENDDFPHEAIRVTNIKLPLINVLDPLLLNLYKIIYRNTIESSMPDVEYDTYELTISAPLNNYYTHIMTKGHFLTKIQYLKSNIVKYQYITSQLFESSQHLHYTECSLIKKLEELSIGRPSTYVNYSDIIIKKGYVKLKDLNGHKEDCTDFYLRNDLLEEKMNVKTFGYEKNKLIIQDTGILCIEFLLKHFGNIFDYSYTKNLEIKLDSIKENSSSWTDICKLTNKDLIKRIKELKKNHNNSFNIDEKHTLQFTSFGAIVKCFDIDNNIDYIPVKKSLIIDMEKLSNNDYKLEELLEFPQSLLGSYENKPLYLRVGKFGSYLEWNDQNINIKDMDIELDKITITDAITFIEKDKIPRKGLNTILRVLDINTSIRKGKFGPYIYYKTNLMKKPKFINIEGMLNVLECDKKELLSLV